VKAIINKVLTTCLMLALLTGISACTIITGEYDSPAAGEDSTPLALMLNAVPNAGTTTLLYNDIPALSGYHDREVPPRTASTEEKMEWWASFQDAILWGYPAPFVTELWGFDAVDVSGILTFWSDSLVTILSGDLDTTAFRRKLLSYGYEEDTYLGSPVFSGTPESNENFSVGILPHAFGIINGVRTGAEFVSFILMSESGDEDIEIARKSIEASIAAYRQKSSLANESNPLTTLADVVGEVGAAYITTDTRFTFIIEQSSKDRIEQIRESIGPGELSPYNALAMTYHWEDDSIILEFILAYETPAAARANIQVLRERLNKGRSFLFYDAPLSEIWTIEDVTNRDSLLLATVRLLRTTRSHDYFFVDMFYALDYWFLYPNQ